MIDQEGMLQFSELAALLGEQGNRSIVYLAACILGGLFGEHIIEDLRAIREATSIPDIIDGVISNNGIVGRC
jgi:hypothetical protein